MLKVFVIISSFLHRVNPVNKVALEAQESLDHRSDIIIICWMYSAAD